jgi:hypothetical protein
MDKNADRPHESLERALRPFPAGEPLIFGQIPAMQ